MSYPLDRPADRVVPHDPARAVRGGQFRGGYDVYAPGAKVISWLLGKIAHVHPCKTQCDGAKPPPGLDQFSISEETIDEDKDRHLTGLRFFVARCHAVEGLSKGSLHHVQPGVHIADVDEYVHFASNHDPSLRALLQL